MSYPYGGPLLPSLSVIISVRDGAAMLGATLGSLAGQRYPASWEVVVVAHRCTDDTADVAREFEARFPRLAVFETDEPEFKAGAVNFGVSRSGGEALLFLDADDVVAVGYLEAMGRGLSRWSFVGAAVDIELLNDAHVRRRRTPIQQDRIDVMVGFRPGVMSAAMGMRREVFEAVGGFDAELRRLSDVDLSWRLERKGTSARFVPDATVHYRYRPTVWGTLTQERHYGEAQVALYLRHRAYGMPRRTLSRAGYSYLRVLATLAGVLLPGGRARFATLLGASVGRLIGSIRHRVLYL